MYNKKIDIVLLMNIFYWKQIEYNYFVIFLYFKNKVYIQLIYFLLLSMILNKNILKISYLIISPLNRFFFFAIVVYYTTIFDNIMASYFCVHFKKYTIAAFIILIFYFISIIIYILDIKYLSLKMIIFSNSLSLEIKIFIEK